MHQLFGIFGNDRVQTGFVGREMEELAVYLPIDRRLALRRDEPLKEFAAGVALFADARVVEVHLVRGRKSARARNVVPRRCRSGNAERHVDPVLNGPSRNAESAG